MSTLSAPPAPPAPPVSRDVSAVVRELFELSQAHPELVQFRSLAGAHQYRLLYDLVLRFVPRGACVLDWGPGNGHFSYFLQRLGYRATGYSLEPFDYRSMLPRPAEYAFVAARPDEPTALPFDAHSFDAVSSVGVLEHVHEAGGRDAASLAEIERILRPQGIFICYHLPNRWSAIEALASRMPKRYAHSRKYTERSVRELVGQSGLELVELHRYGALPRNSLGGLAAELRDSAGVARLFDLADRVLRVPLRPWVQNFAFVARKP